MVVTFIHFKVDHSRLLVCCHLGPVLQLEVRRKQILHSITHSPLTLYSSRAIVMQPIQSIIIHSSEWSLKVKVKFGTIHFPHMGSFCIGKTLKKSNTV